MNDQSENINHNSIAISSNSKTKDIEINSFCRLAIYLVGDISFSVTIVGWPISIKLF